MKSLLLFCAIVACTSVLPAQQLPKRIAFNPDMPVKGKELTIEYDFDGLSVTSVTVRVVIEGGIPWVVISDTNVVITKPASGTKGSTKILIPQAADTVVATEPNSTKKMAPTCDA